MRTSLHTHALRLLLGGLLLLTSACPGPSEWLDQSGPAGSLTLTPADPQARLRLHVAVSARKGSGAKISSLYVGFMAEPRWQLSETDSEEVHPWYRARLVDEHDEQVVDESSFIIDEARPLGKMTLSPHLDVDDDIERFEGTYRLELERQGAPSEGAIPVDWKTEISALTGAGHAEDLEVTFTQL